MLRIAKRINNFPLHSPMNFSGKLTCKIVLKKDYTHADGTQAMYAQVFLNKKKKMFNLYLYVLPEHFDPVKQRVKPAHPSYKDFNLLIEKKLADLNGIEVSYRLSGVALTIERLVTELTNPSSRLDFITFWEQEMERQKDILKPGTYRHQYAVLTKIKSWKPQILFIDINEDLIKEMMIHFKKKRGNTEATIYTTIRSFKKYLAIAEKRGIIVTLPSYDIKVKRNFNTQRTFLMPAELQKIYQYWTSDFINATHKAVLAQFLFSCFTGLRFSDIQTLTNDNIFGDFIAVTTQKTDKLQRISLNASAKKFLDPVHCLGPRFSNQHINDELKNIMKVVGIKKKVSFHVSRHTFATNFLLSGGRLEHLQKLLGHSMIRETMVYVHIVESITDTQIHNMDEILFSSPS